MKLRTVYLLLCLAGAVLPYWQFLPWVLEHGLNLPLLVEQLFANRISAFFGMDVVVSSVATLVFVEAESARRRVPHKWVPWVAVFTVGVSLALPLFLYLREGGGDRDQGLSAAQ